MTDESAGRDQERETPQASRPAFMGTAAPVPDRARRQSTVPRWVPLSIAVALLAGFGLGVGGTLLVTGGDEAATAY